MQITSTLNQPKMDPTNGNLTATAPIEPLTPGSADQVAGAFCRAFYTTASESRGSIAKFYGHESLFEFEGQIVTGATEIAKHYAKLPESTHFKINSIKGLPLLHSQGVMIHVLGTLNRRPFTQSFILGQQGQKKYYVEVDYLAFIDKFFDDVSEQSSKPSAATTTAPAPAPVATTSGSSSSSNGKGTKPDEAKKTPQKPQPKKEETAKPKAEPVKPKEEKKPVAPVVVQPKVVAPAPEPVVAQAPPAPRTWAHLVGGGAKQQPPQQSFAQGPTLQQQQQMHHQMQQQHQQQQQMFQQQRAQQSQSGEHHEENLNERKIYLGGITREIVPSNTAQAETEIKQVFYKYGEVEEVRMPRKVLDSPNDTSKHAFAFITMRTKQGVQAIFGGATRDEQGTWKLPLKLDAFGFDGLAQISEQRDPPSGGFRGGRGGFQQRGGGGGGGQFFRGGRGGAPRGGARGGFQNLNGQH